jgi:hypothetical protein
MKCETCKRLLEVHGTCEYVLPWYCSCILFELGTRKRNTQSLLKTSSTDRTRVRYWLKKLKDSAEKPAPNLPNPVTPETEKGQFCQMQLDETT